MGTASNTYTENNPTILIILGATGDLTRRKLVPALFYLYRKKFLPSMFQIVGFARSSLSDEDFRSFIQDVLKKDLQKDAALVDRFVQLFVYRQGNFDTKEGYHNLAQLLGYTDNAWKLCSNKLFYLAVSPQHYRNIFTHLSASDLTVPCSNEKGWTRIIVEKPFGQNLKTAQELDKLLGKLFKDEQIYRIDHYLGKETVQNILAFRFSNAFLEPAWNKDSIESIQIRGLESIGLEGRGMFYDGIGSLRDVGQNHLLQLLALFTMENPQKFDAQSIREKRAKVLESLITPTLREIKESTIRGQYEGYRTEEGVVSDSDTETYFRIRAFLNTPRWEGVPIYLESGKKINEVRKEVVVTFAHPSPCLCPPSRHYQNVLRYQIEPQEGIFTSFWVKKPGAKMILEEKDFSFNYAQAYAKEEFIDAHAKLLLDAIEGNQTLFVSTREVVASWKFVDPIVSAWKKNNVALDIYPPRSSASKIGQKEKPTIQTKRGVIGCVGAGKMGGNIARRLEEKGWEVHVTDTMPQVLNLLRTQSISVVSNLKALIQALPKPRLLWLMIPAQPKQIERGSPKGRPAILPVDEVIFGKEGLVSLLQRGDMIIDGGNSFYEDSIRRAKKLKRYGINFLDVGFSGGPTGARNGGCLMIGGDKKLYERNIQLFRDLSVKDGYAYVGVAGAGHFIKMVHNSIEYGMMQSIAEGFSVMDKSPFKFDLESIARLYNHGSVIESRLIDWLERALRTYGKNMKGVSGAVSHTGEGEWTVKTAKKLKVSTPVLSQSFEFRLRSRRNPSYTGKILSALRNQFGGHDIKKTESRK